jgi:sugar/nucleoside kinase (ribokinase family)
VETDPWPAGTLQSLADKSSRVLVTLGDKGADEYHPTGQTSGAPSQTSGATPGTAGAPSQTCRRLQPVKITPVDTNGAGDTFAAVYMIALLRGEADPGAAATW